MKWNAVRRERLYLGRQKSVKERVGTKKTYVSSRECAEEKDSNKDQEKQMSWLCCLFLFRQSRETLWPSPRIGCPLHG